MEKHENTVFHKFKSRLKCATVGLMAVNLALAATLLALIPRPASRRKQDGCAPEINLNQTKPDAGYRRYCFRLSERECLERGYDLKQEHNETVCCGNLNEHLHGVMAETISRRLLWDTTKALTLNRVKRYISKLFLDPLAITERPVAHVGILQNGNFTGPDSEAPRVQWEPSGERSFVSGGLIHGGDRLIVTLPGSYYVYTGLQFTVNPHTAPNDAIVAFLYRHSTSPGQSGHWLGGPVRILAKPFSGANYQAESLSPSVSESPGLVEVVLSKPSSMLSKPSTAVQYCRSDRVRLSPMNWRP